MKSPPPLLIRADASPDIGIGHVMRMLALAQGYRSRGGQVTMATASMPDWIRKRLGMHGVGVKTVPYHPGGHEDAGFTAKLARALNVRWIALDGYHFNLHFQQMMRATGAQLLVMDDYAHLNFYDADLLVNQNLGAENLEYSINSEARLLLGTRYILFRDEFHGAKRERPLAPKPIRVLITFGGSDPYGMSLRILEALKTSTLELEIKVAIGDNTPNCLALKRAANNAPHKTNISFSTNNMAHLICWADAAFSAGGSTIWELLLLRVPTAAVIAAENQRHSVQNLSKKGWIANLGHAHELDDDVLCARANHFLRNLKPVIGCTIDTNGVNYILQAMFEC